MTMTVFGFVWRFWLCAMAFVGAVDILHALAPL